MKILIFGIIFVVSPMMATFAQDTQTPSSKADQLDSNYYNATDRKTYFGPVADYTEVVTHFVDTAYWCVVDCNVITPPQPLLPTRITVTLSMGRELFGGSAQQDIEFIVGRHTYGLDWLSPERFVWPGPRTTGEQFTIDLEFISLASGTFDFWVAQIGPSRQGNLVSVQWSLDEEGSLTYLRNARHGGTDPNPPIKTYFFDEDLVRIERPRSFGVDADGWDCQLEIEPPFSLGNPSTVTYFLTPKEYVPQGIDFRFNGEHMKIVSYPPVFDNPIGAGETVELVIEVVPASVRDIQILTLRFDTLMNRGQSRTGQAGISCQALFKEDGSLRFVNTKGSWYVDESMYPSSFPKADDRGGFRSKIIYKDQPHPYPEMVRGMSEVIE